MIVTHLLQVFGLLAMEPPVSLRAKSLRDEKVEVHQPAIRMFPVHRRTCWSAG
jgi:glucose-6-phosphate 1-dehydrogenase